MNDNPTSTPTAPTESPLVADPRHALAECATVARSVMSQISGADVDTPTPAGMPVGDLVPHMVMTMRRLGCSGRDEPAESWPAEADDVTVDNGVTELDQALAAAVEAWSDDAVLEQPRPLPWDPSTTGAETLAVYVSELLVHTWDLARGIGADPSWTPETIAVADAAMREQLPMADRTPMWQAMAEQLGIGPDELDNFVPFADAVAIPGDAPPLDRLVAWVGRNPASGH